VEMAEGKPPHHEVQPLRAIVLITSKAPPTLSSQHFGSEIVDFLAKSLVKDPKARKSSAELLKHPFVMKSSQDLQGSMGNSHPTLLELANKCFPLISEYRKTRDLEVNGLQKSSSYRENSVVLTPRRDGSQVRKEGSLVVKGRETGSGSLVKKEVKTREGL